MADVFNNQMKLGFGLMRLPKNPDGSIDIPQTTEMADRFIAEYYQDAKALGIHPATVHPRATDHIDEIITLITRLIENGHAYAVPSGDVYYRVSAFPGYGKLSAGY